MAIAGLTVKYFGTNVGKIYLNDLLRRRQLGGALEGPSYTAGNDEYIVWGETISLPMTSDVIASRASGVLKFFSTLASSTVFAHNGAPLVLEEANYDPTIEFARRDLGDTGYTRYSNAYMSELANPLWDGSTGSPKAAGATGYYYGNE